ncbi:hypothetical protein H0H92_007322 [Tricholoma furcatifolium]|nr:hypothetical protein H0H92_007322 [Tricholoma furcatifolium]
MASLHNILNPEDGRRRTVRLIVNMDQASASDISCSPGTSASDASDNMTTEESYRDHEVHPNCPDSLNCLPNTDGRPQHTLPVILRCAILGSPRKRLTIREIYAAMEKKLFERQPRPVTDPGFGSYWTVNLSAPPGTKRPRKRGRQAKEGPDPSLPPKKRGRPRKSPLPDGPLFTFADDDDEYKDELNGEPVASSSKQNGDEVMLTPRSHGSGDKQDLEDEQDTIFVSEEECESEDERPMHPMERRNSLEASGLSEFPVPRVIQAFSLPPFSTLQNPDSIIDSLHTELATLRRQSADAISLSLRLTEQLAQAQTETSRTHSILHTIEKLLEEESQRRRELEEALDREARRRRKAEEALNAILARPLSDQPRLT